MSEAMNSYDKGEHDSPRTDYTKHFTVEKRIEMFAADLINQINPGILVPRFHRLIIDTRKEMNEALVRGMGTFKRRTILHQSWYSVQERIYHFRERIDVQRRFDFDQLVEDIQKNAVDEHIMAYLPQKFTITKSPMRTIEELKREISELEQVRVGLNSEIEVLNAKNSNAQARRDRVTSKIDGLKWMLNEKKDD